ncbi:MAG TPA: hypothetical protein V6D10_17270 [Trichocoleus sp.]|jgi:hypothetical protein
MARTKKETNGTNGNNGNGANLKFEQTLWAATADRPIIPILGTPLGRIKIAAQLLIPVTGAKPD